MSDPTPKFPRSPEVVVATLTELFRHQKNNSVCEVLENAATRIEVTGYDNLDGGQYYFTLFLELPLILFARVEAEVSRLEKLIANKLPTVLRSPGNMWLREVAISPILEEPKRSAAPKIAPVDVEHLWKPGMLRLFISHISAEKAGVSKLKAELSRWGVDSFVAHEDIEPNKLWQTEIELALNSMHALAALLTPGFHESKWTDQEVGFALGKGTMVIAIRLGLDPYGFIGKQQGLPGNFDAHEPLASGIVDLLLKNKTTADIMMEGLISTFESAISFNAPIAISKKLEGMKYISADHLRRLEAACEENSIVKESWYVPERIQKIVQRFKPAPPADISF